MSTHLFENVHVLLFQLRHFLSLFCDVHEAGLCGKFVRVRLQSFLKAAGKQQGVAQARVHKNVRQSEKVDGTSFTFAHLILRPFESIKGNRPNE